MADEAHRFKAEVLTPEGRVFSGEAFQISARTVVGEVGVRARHAPMLARTVPHELRIYADESEFAGSGGGRRYAAAEGWIEVFANKVTVLVSEAVEPDALDPADLRSRLEDAEQRLREAEQGSAQQQTAEQDKERAETFLAIAGG